MGNDLGNELGNWGIWGTEFYNFFAKRVPGILRARWPVLK